MNENIPFVVAAYAIASPESFWLGSGLPIGGGLAVAAVVALAATSRALVRRDRLHPSERLRRVGYGTASLALVTMSLSRTLVVAGPGGALLDVVTLAAVLALLALAELRIRAPLRDLLATLTLLTAFTLHGVAFVAATPYGNDAVAARHHAAALLAAGHHPYADFDVRDALARFGMDPQLATHLENGDVLRTYSYPALSFLAVTPFVAAGLGDVRWADLAVVLLIAVVASRAARPAWRPFVLAALMGNDVIVRQYVLAGIDPLWALLVIGAWLARGSLWCGMLLGLALADRQLAWFAFPFVVAAAPARRRTAIVALSLALAVHLPFLATAPWPTAGGILAPLVGPLVSDGVGIMQIGVTDRYVPIAPRLVFTLASLGLLAALLLIAWRRRERLATAPLVWPLVPVFFAWRSLQNYFAFIPLFALVADEELATPPPETAPSARTAPRSTS